jgi:hypothetical protein
MHHHDQTSAATGAAWTPSSRGRRLAHAIHRLREALFELQCEPEPDADAINVLMRRLARVRARSAA